MIPINELRGGNWVNFYYSISGETKPIQINLEWFGNEADQKDSSPIPLTTEILVKLGFETENNKEFFGSVFNLLKLNDNYAIVFGSEFTYEITKRKPLKYIYQLQNLYFALTGEELNIEL